jgi:hypothetical protein
MRRPIVQSFSWAYESILPITDLSQQRLITDWISCMHCCHHRRNRRRIPPPVAAYSKRTEWSRVAADRRTPQAHLRIPLLPCAVHQAAGQKKKTHDGLMDISLGPKQSVWGSLLMIESQNSFGHLQGPHLNKHLHHRHHHLVPSSS